jgi:hypothetical protein
MWVVIHMFVEAILGSLCMAIFMSNKIGDAGGTGSAWKRGGEGGRGWGGGPNNVYPCE